MNDDSDFYFTFSLEQKLRMQLLHSLSLRSTYESYTTVPTRPTRATDKIKFRLMSKCTNKYLASQL